jgi:pimeloyl-ACP methyl ester carboxylesterase
VRTRIDGFEIEYDVRGKGPAVLLLHAFPLGLSMWDPQAEALAATHRVVRFDARGFGGSQIDDVAPLTMERIADDGAYLLDQLSIEEAVVHGCSMGGYAAFAFARRHPRRLAGLVLQDTRAASDTPEAREGRAALAARVLEGGAGVVVEAVLPKLLGETSHRERAPLEATLRERILATSPRALANALYGLAARADSRGMLPKVSVPILVLVGEEDAIVTPDEAKAMAAAIPGARFEAIPRAGHLANLENPDAVNAALRSFLPTMIDRSAADVHGGRRQA